MVGKLRQFRNLTITILALFSLLSCGGGGGGSGTGGGGGTSGPPPGTTVTIDSDADFIAYQVGSSPWQKLDTSNPGPYVIDVGSANGSYGVALVDPTDGSLLIYQATRSELWKITEHFSSQVSHTVSGSVTFSTGGVSAIVAIDNESASVTPTNNNYSLTIPEGTWDAVALEFDTQNGPPTGIIFRRGISVTTDLPNVNFDFSGAGVSSLTGHNISVTGWQNQLSYECYAVTSGGTMVANCDPQTDTWYSADSGTEAGDVYVFAAGDLNQNNRPVSEILSTLDATGQVGDVALDLSQVPSLTGAGISHADTTLPPTFRWSSIPSGLHPFIGLEFECSQGTTTQHSWTVVLTSGWLGTTTSYTFPELSSLSGWNSSWDFNYNDGDISYTATAYYSNKDIQTLMDAEMFREAGTNVHMASVYGTITPAPPATTGVTLTTDADWAAYQVGNGPWIPLTGSSPYQFDAKAADAAYGVAVHFGTENRTEILHFTRDQVWSITTNSNFTTTSFNVSGSVSNLNTGSTADVSIAEENQYGIVNNGNFSISPIPPGTWDIVALERDSSSVVTRYVLSRDLLVNSDISGIGLDFSSAPNVNTNTIIVTGGPVSGGEGMVEVITKNGTVAMLGMTTSGSGDWYSFQGTDVVQGDRYRFTAFDPSVDPEYAYLRVDDATQGAVNYTADLSVISPFTAQDQSNPSGIHPTFPFSGGTVQNQPFLAYHVEYYQGTQQSHSVEWSITVTDSWMAAMGATSYTVPDFSSVSGWQSSYDLAPGQQTTWEAWAVSGTIPGTTGLNDLMSSGGDFMSYTGVETYIALDRGTFTP